MSGPDPANPYQAPAAQPDEISPPGNPLLIPGVFLLVLSSTTLVLILLSIPSQIIYQLRAVDINTPVGKSDFVVSMIVLVSWMCMMGCIIWGSLGMVRLRVYRNAWVAAVLSVIPICSPCFVLGIPFGIWALVVLSRSETRARFQG